MKQILSILDFLKQLFIIMGAICDAYVYAYSHY